MCVCVFVAVYMCVNASLCECKFVCGGVNVNLCQCKIAYVYSCVCVCVF